MHTVDYQAGTPIIKRHEKNQNVYFIISGEVECKYYNDQSIRETPSKNYQTVSTKPFKKTNLKENEVFGIDAFNSETLE